MEEKLARNKLHPVYKAITRSGVLVNEKALLSLARVDFSRAFQLRDRINAPPSASFSHPYEKKHLIKISQ